MSVLINGMEMPKDREIILRIDEKGEVYVYGSYPTELYKAVPVPPHGDLIDRRETIIDANERAFDFWLSDDEVNATIQFLNEQPAIIQAEEGER